MGIDIMTVKVGMCKGVSSEFGEWIEGQIEDFTEHRYCALAPTKEVVYMLRSVAKTSALTDDREVAETLLDEMGYGVEPDKDPELEQYSDTENAMFDGVAVEILIGW